MIAAPAACARSRSAFKGIRYAKVGRACSGAHAGRGGVRRVRAHPVPADAAEAGVAVYGRRRRRSSGPAGGLTPAQLASAYHYDPTGRGTGRRLRSSTPTTTPRSKRTSGNSMPSTGSRNARTPTDVSRRSPRRGARRRCRKPTGRAGRSRSRSMWRRCTRPAPSAGSCWSRPTARASQTSEPRSNGAVAWAQRRSRTPTAAPRARSAKPKKRRMTIPGIVITAATGDDGYDGWTALERTQANASPRAPGPTGVASLRGGGRRHLAGTRRSWQAGRASGVERQRARR